LQARRKNKRIMAREDIARKWLEQVDEDISAAECMYGGGHWLYVGFMCHQAVEKLLKALWTATREDDAPYVHDHWRLLRGLGLIENLTEEQREFVELIKPLYIAARYPEHKRKVATMLNDEACKSIIENTKNFKQWILQKF
jgi:HEPN domain-containing protein